MKTVFVSLPTPEVVQEFVETLTGLDGSFDLVSGNYILDAKSLMGIFTFDLSQPIELRVYNPLPETMAALQQFIAR